MNCRSKRADPSAASDEECGFGDASLRFCSQHGAGMKALKDGDNKTYHLVM